MSHDVSGEAASVRALFRHWPATRHLADRLKPIRFEKQDGTVDTGFNMADLLPVFEEFVRIVDGLQKPPAMMRECAENVRKALPTLRAFDADPLTVMASGANN